MAKYLRLLLFLLFFAPFPSNAHAPNQSYIYLRIYEDRDIEGWYEMNYQDINKVFGIHLEKNASLEEIEPYFSELQDYLSKHSSFSSIYGNHKIVFTKSEIGDVGLGTYAKLWFTLENTDRVPEELDVEYTGVFEKDDTHTAFLMIEYNWKAGILSNEGRISLRFSKNDPKDTLSLTDASLWKGFVAMIKQGVWHIWIGLDHILFLLALILPSVVRRWRDSLPEIRPKNPPKKKKSRFFVWDWFPVPFFRPAFVYIVKIVTFFTVAHTITLSLASLGIVNLPSRLVESVIALSIGLAAYHNIWPIFKGKDWVIAFVFGLFHGFGFASVLSDLGLTSEFLTLSLLGFNIGVEIGQLVIIFMIFPVLFLIRKSSGYPKILVYGSLLLIIISLYWFIERAFDIDLLVEGYLRKQAGNLARSLGLI